MPGVSGCSVMTGEVGVVSSMTHQTVAVIANGMELGITGNCSCEFTIRLSAILETAVRCRIDMTVLTVVTMEVGVNSQCSYVGVGMAARTLVRTRG